MDIYLSTFLLALITAGYSYPNGPPVGTNNICVTMEPGHNSTPKSNDNCPYEIVTNTNGCFKEDLEIQVVVRTKKGYYVDMKGLFVQAREVDAIASFGTFTVEDPKLKTLICEDNDDSAAGHSEPLNSDFVEMTWVAPVPPPSTDPEPDVKIRATIVKNMKTYWVGVESEPLKHQKYCELLPKIKPRRRIIMTSDASNILLASGLSCLLALLVTLMAKH